MRGPVPPAASSTQPGIDSPRNVQVIRAHSPEPVNTFRITSASGKICIMYDSVAPQAGTEPSGKCWIHRCRDATPIVTSAATSSSAIHRRARPRSLGLWIAASRNNTPIANTPTR